MASGSSLHAATLLCSLSISVSNELLKLVYSELNCIMLISCEIPHIFDDFFSKISKQSCDAFRNCLLLHSCVAIVKISISTYSNLLAYSNSVWIFDRLVECKYLVDCCLVLFCYLPKSVPTLDYYNHSLMLFVPLLPSCHRAWNHILRIMLWKISKVM